MASQQKNSVAWYLSAFSCFLVIYGVVIAAVGAAVLFTALVDGGTAAISLSLSSAVLGAAEIALGAVTAATGILGRIAARRPERLDSLHTLSVAGVVGTVLGMGLCTAVGNEPPTALLLDAVLMAIALIVTMNLRKQQS